MKNQKNLSQIMLFLEFIFLITNLWVILKNKTFRKNEWGGWFTKWIFENSELNLKIFGRGLVLLDTGNANNLLTASNFIKTIEDRQGIKIACLEEIALNNNC